MKKIIERITADRITKTATLVSLGLIAITVIYSIIIYNYLPPYLPLFNQLRWGDPRLAEQPYIFLLPGLTLLLLIGNTFFASVIYMTMPLVARIVSITTLLISALTLIFIFRVTQLVM